MKKIKVSIAILFFCVIFLPVVSSARNVEPIVNTTWLEQNLGGFKAIGDVMVGDMVAAKYTTDGIIITKLKQASGEKKAQTGKTPATVAHEKEQATEKPAAKKKRKVSGFVGKVTMINADLIQLTGKKGTVTFDVSKAGYGNKIVVVDIRKVEDYKAGHIPNAVNAFYGSWAVMKGGLRNELPANDDLFDVIGSAGIGADSIVVLVGKTDAIPDRTDITRVAWTLKYAGIPNVAILDGGYNKWTADKKTVSTDAVKPNAKPYQAKVNENLFVKKDYVIKSIGKAAIVDVREPDFYKGAKKLDFVAKTGRIAKSVNLPTSQAYKQDGTFHDKKTLMKIVSGVVGNDKTKEIITYCDTGKVCTGWSFLMTELLGYKNVKVYDGSSEEWTKDPQAPWEQ